MRERFYNFSVSNRGFDRIQVSAPTRIDLAGGTIDIWPLYLEHEGACTVNAAISLRAHAEIEPRTDGRIELRSIDTKRQQSAARWQELDPRIEPLAPDNKLIFATGPMTGTPVSCGSWKR